MKEVGNFRLMQLLVNYLFENLALLVFALQFPNPFEFTRWDKTPSSCIYRPMETLSALWWVP